MARVFEGPYLAWGKNEKKFCLGLCRVLLFISFSFIPIECLWCSFRIGEKSSRIFVCLEFWESENKTFAYKLLAVLFFLEAVFSVVFSQSRAHYFYWLLLSCFPFCPCRESPVLAIEFLTTESCPIWNFSRLDLSVTSWCIVERYMVLVLCVMRVVGTSFKTFQWNLAAWSLLLIILPFDWRQEYN